MTSKCAMRSNVRYDEKIVMSSEVNHCEEALRYLIVLLNMALSFQIASMKQKCTNDNSYFVFTATEHLRLKLP